MVGSKPLRLLGSHVGGGTEQHPNTSHTKWGGERGRVGQPGGGGGGGLRRESLRQPEVEDLHRTVGPHLDIGRFQIAVDDSLLVRGFERLGDLFRDRERFIEWNRALRDSIGKRGTFDQFEHQRRRAIALLEPVNRGNVRMV